MIYNYLLYNIQIPSPRKWKTPHQLGNKILRETFVQFAFGAMWLRAECTYIFRPVEGVEGLCTQLDLFKASDWAVTSSLTTRPNFTLVYNITTTGPDADKISYTLWEKDNKTVTLIVMCLGPNLPLQMYEYTHEFIYSLK